MSSLISATRQAILNTLLSFDWFRFDVQLQQLTHDLNESWNGFLDGLVKTKGLTGDLYRAALTKRWSIVLDLSNHPWITETDPSVKDRLCGLSPAWDGFLIDLRNRSDIIGGLKVLKIAEIQLTGFSATVIFEVRNPSGQVYKYQYMSWRQGPASGTKGLVFLADENGTVTHYIHATAEKFAAGGLRVSDAIGGFADPNDPNSNLTFLREAKEELGLQEIKVIKTVHLGEVAPDYGAMNNRPSICFTVIHSSGFIPGVNQDEYEVGMNFKIRPVSELPADMATNLDGFHLAIYARMVAKGHIIQQDGQVVINYK